MASRCPPGQFITAEATVPCSDLPPLSTAGTAGSVLMLSRTTQRLKLVLALLIQCQARVLGLCRARAARGAQAQIGFCFRLDGLHANGLVSYAFDGKVTTNKSLGEAARVRRDAHRA